MLVVISEIFYYLYLTNTLKDLIRKYYLLTLILSPKWIGYRNGVQKESRKIKGREKEGDDFGLLGTTPLFFLPFFFWIPILWVCF